MASRIIIIACLFTLPAAVHGEEPKPDAGKILGQTRDTGSLPVWTKPDGDTRQDLGKAARAVERGVFIAGSTETTHGTAWVISKKHRLLITNAHVADLLHEGKGEMFAIPNGTSQVYKVEKVWYHPGVRRYLKGNQSLSVRSMDPKEGDIDPCSPDLAVLKLSSDGPDPEVEFPLATPEEIASLFAQPAALFGFPGYDTADWPKLGQKVAATYRDGVVSRITDFEMGATAPVAEKQYLQYTIPTWGGFSGSPVFLPNGHVAAVHNMGRTEKTKAGVVQSFAHGVRADCVLEMLVHHGLEEMVPFKIDKAKVLAERWVKPDARTEKARADFAGAIALADEADYLVFIKQEYVNGIKKCDEVLKLDPNNALAYSIRGCAYGNFRIVNSGKLSDKQELELAIQAYEDVRKAAKLDPTNIRYVLQVCSAINNIGYVTEDKAHHRQALEIADKVLTADGLSNVNKARAMKERAVAYDNLGELETAWRIHNEAVKLAPDDQFVLWTRADFLRARGFGDHGQADLAKAKEIRAKKMETGLKIADITDEGAAKKAGLNAGDIIVNIGSKRVRSFDELAAALATTKGAVEIVIIKSESGKRETFSVTPLAGKIGVSVDPVEVK
jgi:V8-like Glu-specific endopeptidase/tetratricopeptide (TPR) repeat protein